eukprot:scaffold13239_cov69-Phaeocystis_antarctica.AAC.1
MKLCAVRGTRSSKSSKLSRPAWHARVEVAHRPAVDSELKVAVRAPLGRGDRHGRRLCLCLCLCLPYCRHCRLSRHRRRLRLHLRLHPCELTPHLAILRRKARRAAEVRERRVTLPLPQVRLSTAVERLGARGGLALPRRERTAARRRRRLPLAKLQPTERQVELRRRLQPKRLPRHPVRARARLGARGRRELGGAREGCGRLGRLSAPELLDALGLGGGGGGQ